MTMGTIAAYSLVAGTYLLTAYLIYKWLLSGENQPTFNRFTLLCLYALALVLPFAPELSLSTKITTFVAAELETGAPVIAIIEDSTLYWQSVAIFVYTAGMILTAIASSISFIRIISVIRKGRKIESYNHTIIVLPSTDLAPFSWMRYIVMSESDYKEAGEMIICHESSHLYLRHWTDLLFAQIVVIVLWYNPASWLMRSELRSVHEYQADSAVLRSGANARQYQLLLIKKAVGRRIPSLANSLNHSKLKKRITMMCNPETGKLRRLRALAMVPAFAAALALVNIPSVASAVTEVAEAPSIETFGKVNEKTVAAQDPVADPDVLPEFPGGEQGLYKYLSLNIRYPEKAATRGEQGYVLVQFIVEANGSITNCQVKKNATPLLDGEAIRVVSGMPKWIPGKSGGKAVRCTYTIPVRFKLSAGDTKNFKKQ